MNNRSSNVKSQAQEYQEKIETLRDKVESFKDSITATKSMLEKFENDPVARSEYFAYINEDESLWDPKALQERIEWLEANTLAHQLEIIRIKSIVKTLIGNNND